MTASYKICMKNSYTNQQPHDSVKARHHKGLESKVLFPIEYVYQFLDYESIHHLKRKLTH